MNTFISAVAAPKTPTKPNGRRYRYYVDRMRELEIEPCPFGGHRGAAAESAG